MYSISLDEIRQSVRILRQSAASEYLKFYLTLKAFGLSVENSVEVDTSNTTPAIEKLFLVRGLQQAKRNTPFYDPLYGRTMKQDAPRSIIQTHCKKMLHDKTTAVKIYWLRADQTASKKWRVSFAPSYPRGLGSGKAGMALREDKQVTIDTPSFLLWLFRYETFKDKPTFDNLLDRMKKEMHFHDAEVRLLFAEANHFTRDPFVETPLDETELAHFIADESVRKVPRASSSARQKLSEEEVAQIVQSSGLQIRAFDQLVEETFLPKETLSKIGRLLRTKRQIVFYGPPGTGKTFVAKKFAAYFAGGSQNVERVQFHPSFSYEDFVEGITAEAKGTQIHYSVRAGIVRKLCSKAIERPEQTFVLLIDEINRGNLAKIFGEIIQCLDYRGKENKITLPLSQTEEFHLPENVFIIGTMNSADRSIAFVDYALRRRFYFVDFLANSATLNRWYDANPPKLAKTKITSFLENINSTIRQTDKLGKYYEIGQSYFMIKDLDIITLTDIWTYGILPLLEEYYFGDPDKVQGFQKVFEQTFAEELASRT